MRRRYRRTLWTLLAAALLGIFAFFFLTGSFFLTSVVLPMLSSRWGVEVVADRVELSLFRPRIVLENLRVGPEERPYFRTRRGEARYAFSMLAGKGIKLSEVRMEESELTLYHLGGRRWSVKNPAVTGTKQRRKKRKKPFLIDLEDVVFRNSDLRLIFGDPDAGGALELTGLELTADRFANGRRMRLKGKGGMRFSSSRANHIDAGSFTLDFETGLGTNLVPETFNVSCGMAGLFGSISGEPFNDGAIQFAAEGSHDSGGFEFRNLTLTQRQGGSLQSDVVLSGRVRYQPFEMRGDIDIRHLSEEITSLLFDLGFGFNPGRAELQYTGKFAYARRKLSASGMLRANRAGDAIIDLERISLPPLRLDGEYDFEVDLGESLIDLRKFALVVAEREKEVASFRLQRPIRYSWRKREASTGQQAVFDLDCHEFDLKLLKFLIPGDAPFRFDSGRFSSHMQLTLKRNLSAFSLLGTGRISDGGCCWDGRNIVCSEILTDLDMELRRDFHWTLRDLSLSLKNDGVDLGNANFSGEGELSDVAGKLSAQLEGLTPELAVWSFPALEPFLPEYRKLGFGTAKVSFELEKSTQKDPVCLQTLDAGVYRDGRLALRLQAGPYRLTSSSAGGDELKFQLSGELPLATVNGYLGKEVQVDSGTVKLSAEGSIAPGFRSAIFSGEFLFDDLAARIYGRNYRDFSVQCAFSGYMPAMNYLEMRTLNFYLRRLGKPALRLECPGTWDLERSSYSGEWAIRYLNDQFLSLIFPDAVFDAQLTGKMQVSARDHFRVLRASGAFELDKLILSSRPEELFTGTLSLMAEKDERRLLLRRISAGVKQKDGLLFDLSGECRADLSAPDGAVTMQIASDGIDAGKLLALIPVRDRERNTNADRVPRLNFGGRPVDFGCRLRKIRLTPSLSADLDTRLRFRGDSLETDHLLLQLNNARFDGEFRGSNTKQGVLFSAALRGDDPLSLPPLMELIEGTSQKGAAGTLRDFNLNLRFLENGRPDSCLETLTGSLSMGFRDLTIPDTVVKGEFARLLLFPIEVVGQFSSLLADDLAAWKESIISTESLTKRLKTIRLDEGIVRLHANEGRVRVDECAFFGDWVSRLAFSGAFDLARGRKLNLTSRLTVGGFQATIPMEGTLDNPFVRFESIAGDSFKTLLTKIRELNLIGTSADPSDPNKVEPVIMIDKLPSAGMIRELQKLFNELWNY
ncbi:hypothetical protein [uncultured Victivallis sp.]|uniref:hypothetical protein n=1 Tax=uncultured Victivallis sp. TaxID=354118 RepID=UPI0025FEE544|nr:hypothetical protein [uncultured Victivallis sp.]